MQPFHEMDMAIREAGEIKIELRTGGAIPDLIGRFPRDVQLKARRWVVWPSAYERKLWKATRGMPFWARETVRQHILQERRPPWPSTVCA